MTSVPDRVSERTRLEAVVEGRGPTLTLVDGSGGTGKSHLVRAGPLPSSAATYVALPLADADHRALLATRLEEWAGVDAPVEPESEGRSGAAFGPDLDWPDLFGALVDRVVRSRQRLVLVLDDAHRLVESRRRLPEMMATFWADVRARSLPIHLVLVGRSPHLARAFDPEEGPLADYVTERITLEAHDYRTVAALVPGWPALDRLRLYGVFGGLPSRLRHLDPSVTLATNVQRTLLDPEAPLLREGLRVLERDFSSTARYVSILRAMAGGAREWGDMVDEVRDVESGGALGPYLSRLQELGHLQVERSLDAAPRSRRRRYRIGDPFLALWHAAILPRASELTMGRGRALRAGGVRTDIERHMARVFPLVCRQYLERYATDRLGAVARESGGLWGPGYDMDPAATLRNGAVCYGRAVWSEDPAAESPVEAVEIQLRRTRYGFGKEARLRLAFSAGGFEPVVRRRAARDHLVEVFDADDLLE